jgi:homoserine kinase
VTQPAGPGQIGTVEVRVPATSANLGPGFDSLGLALRLHDTVRASLAGRGVHIEISGAGAEAAGAGEQHLVIRAMRTAFARIGPQPAGICLSCQNEVPQAYGLGSSAGAIVAGLLAARALAGPDGLDNLPDDEVARLAARLEGHPDNVAACLAGGLTIAWNAADGARFTRLEPAPSLAPVLCLPTAPLPTAVARAVLPAEVPHADAAANSARAALLVTALTIRPELLLDATEDFLHQRYRAEAMPQSADLVGRLRAAGLPAAVSGAGPAVLAFCLEGREPSAADAAAVAGTGWRVLELAVDSEGAVVQEPVG